MKMMKRLLNCLLAVVLLVGLLPSSLAVEKEGDITISVERWILTDSLQIVRAEEIYAGITQEVEYCDRPEMGNQFLLVEIALTLRGGVTINNDMFIVKTSGEESYGRVLDDSFLNTYGYNALTHGTGVISTSGWILFEIPERYTEEDIQRAELTNGTSSAAFLAKDTTVIVPQSDAALTAYQQKLDESYQQQYRLGNYTANEPLIIVNPYELAPQTALLMFSSDEPVRVETVIEGKDAETTISNRIEEFRTDHEIPLIGLYSGVNHVILTTENANGVRKTYTYTIETEELPSYMKEKGISVAKSEKSVIGNSLYFLKDSNRTIVDGNGDIRGYFIDEIAITNSGIDETTEEGVFFCSVDAYSQTGIIYQMDYMGRVYREILVDDYTDHDAMLLPDEKMLIMYSEIDLTTGAMKAGIPWWDVYNSSQGSFEVRTYGSTDDWLHPNTINPCGDGAVIVSARNQHAVAKLSYPEYEVQWILSPNEKASPQNADKYLTPIGENFEWFYSQHDCETVFVDEKNGIVELTLFDNGVQRGLNPGTEYDTAEMYSRIVRYRIDEQNMTVEQIWEWGKEELGRNGLSAIHGSCQYDSDMDTYLGNFDARWSVERFGVADGAIFPSRIIEVTSDKEVVFDLNIDEGGIYRTEKIEPELLYKAWNGISEIDRAYFYIADEVATYDNTLEMTDGDVEYKINSISATTDYLKITGWAALAGEYSGGYNAAKLLLTHMESNDSYLYDMEIDATQRYNSDAPQTVVDQLEPNTGFCGKRLNISGLSEGSYEITVVVARNEMYYPVTLEQTLQIGESAQKVADRDILTRQAEINAQIVLAASNATFENPYVIVDPYGISPLTAIAAFRTETPAQITVEVESKNGVENISNHFSESCTEHYIPIYGLYAGESTTVRLYAEYENGNKETVMLSVAGQTLPVDFDTITVVKSNTELSAEGWTFSCPSYLNAVDSTGAVRWIIADKMIGSTCGIIRLQNGNFLLGGDKGYGSYYKYDLFEMNMTGQIIHEYMVNGYHHDAAEMENGNLLVLANSVDGEVVEDLFYEIDRETGAILRTWDLDSYFDVGNKNADGKHISDVNYGASAGDWFHNNAISYNPVEHTVMLSGRQQDAVIKLDLDTGKLIWILSDPNDLWPEHLEELLLTPVGDDFEWQYGQHCVIELPNGDIMLFDNGDYRSKTEEGVVDAIDGYSRAVIYRVNEATMTVEQIWQFGKEYGNELVSAYVSSVQYLGENHYLIDFGGIIRDANGDATYEIMKAASGTSHTKIYEIKDDEIVYAAELVLPRWGANTYRAARYEAYASASELDLKTAGTRLGGLYSYSLANEIAFNIDDVTEQSQAFATDNGVQLTISYTLPEEKVAENVRLIFAGESACYAIDVGAEDGNEYVLNNSELPVGTYRLYLQTETDLFALNLEWTNTTQAMPFPEAYNVAVYSSDAERGWVAGTGVYYANTPLTVTACAVEGYEFLGWYNNFERVSASETFSFIAREDIKLMAVFAAPGEDFWSAKFGDLNQKSYYYDAVVYALEHSLMNGVSDTKFAPDGAVSREQFITILWRTVGSPAVECSLDDYADVDENGWYIGAVRWAVSEGILRGCGNNTLGIGEAITREQLATILYRYVQMKGQGDSAEADLSAFVDAASVSRWAESGVTWAVGTEIVQGIGNAQIAPANGAMRAEAATMIQRFCENVLK